MEEWEEEEEEDEEERRQCPSVSSIELSERAGSRHEHSPSPVESFRIFEPSHRLSLYHRRDYNNTLDCRIIAISPCVDQLGFCFIHSLASSAFSLVPQYVSQSSVCLSQVD